MHVQQYIIIIIISLAGGVHMYIHICLCIYVSGFTSLILANKTFLIAVTSRWRFHRLIGQSHPDHEYQQQQALKH